jgi:DNA-binding winged helix-turn-helix (wHTH) protein/tetratricopeptide (TPR) repeat protein
MLASSRQLLRFDSFTIDRLKGVVRRGDAEVTLRRQSFEVLQYLAERPHQVVSSEDLTSAIWTARPADHHASVSQCIREIRRAMGDDARWIIKTVSGRGYEFMADVVRIAPPLPETSVSDPTILPDPVESQGLAAPPAVAGELQLPPALASLRPRWRQIVLPAVALLAALIAGCWMIWPLNQQVAPRSELTMMAAPTLAVLPFRIVGKGSGEAGLLETVAEQVTTELAGASRGYDLIVRPSTAINGAVVPTADEARLGARYAVHGTTWLDDGTIRINVQLIETPTNRQVWGAPFESESAKPNRIDRLVARIARELIVHVRASEFRRPLPQIPEAGHFVLQGRALLESERDEKRLREAQVLFETALKMDANNIYALQGYARTKLNQVLSGSLPLELRPAALTQAEAAIDRMIAQDNRIQAAHLLRGTLLMARGDVDNAIVAFEFALSIRPNYRVAHAELGRAKIHAGLAQEALKHINDAIQLGPADPDTHAYYAWGGEAALYLGDHQTAVRWLLKAAESNRKFHNPLRLLAVAYLGLGEHEKAAHTMAEYLRFHPNFSIERWKQNALRSKPIVIEQRKSIEDAMRRLGVPEGNSITARN